MSDLPITATLVEGVPIRDAMNTLSIRQSWLSGTTEEDGQTIGFDLDSGAGLGSPRLELSVTVGDDGGTTREVVDVRDLLHWWLPGHLERRKAGEISFFGSARAQGLKRTDIRPDLNTDTKD